MLAKHVITLDLSFDITKLLHRKALLAGGFVNRQAVISLHRFVGVDVLFDLVWRNLGRLSAGLLGLGGFKRTAKGVIMALQLRALSPGHKEGGPR